MFDESLKTFEIFSLPHGLAVGFLLILYVLLIVFRKPLAARPRLCRVLEIIAAVFLLSMQLGFYLWTFSLGEQSWELLPFGVCHLSMYFTAFALLFQSEKLFRFIFPWALIGAILSLVVADLSYVFPHFRFFHYFGNHGIFLLANLYFIVVKRWKVTYRDLWISGGVLFAMAMVMRLVVNPLLGTNHMFMAKLPLPVQPVFYWLGDPGWVFGFIFGVVILFHGAWGFELLLRRATQ